MGKRKLGSKKYARDDNPLLALSPKEEGYNKGISILSSSKTRETKPEKVDKLPGTPEEKEEARLLAEEYTFKILDYATADDIPQEELDFARRYMYFVKYGPNKDKFKFYNKSKLTHGDALYILSTSAPTKTLAKRYNVDESIIREIRRGESNTWKAEYALVKRLRTIIYHRLRQLYKNENRLIVHGVYKREEDGEEKLLCLFTSKRKAINFRKEMLTKNELTVLLRRDALDLTYPIKPVDIYK